MLRDYLRDNEENHGPSLSVLDGPLPHTTRVVEPANPELYRVTVSGEKKPMWFHRTTGERHSAPFPTGEEERPSLYDLQMQLWGAAAGRESSQPGFVRMPIPPPEQCLANGAERRKQGRPSPRVGPKERIESEREKPQNEKDNQQPKEKVDKDQEKEKNKDQKAPKQKEKAPNQQGDSGPDDSDGGGWI